MIHGKRIVTAAGLTLLTVIVVSAGESDGRIPAAPQGMALRATVLSQPQPRPRSPSSRLDARLRKRIHFTYRPEVLAQANKQRAELLRDTITLSFLLPDGKETEPVSVQLREFSWLVRPTYSLTNLTYAISEDGLTALIRARAQEFASAALHSTIVHVEARNGVLYASSDRVAQDGLRLDDGALSAAVQSAVRDGERVLRMSIRMDPGRIFNASGYELGSLEFLGEGLSNFEGSGNGRIANVRKGIREHVNNALVPPGGTFSFNSTLGPVTLSRGWQNALTIFNGDVLLPAPGGGLCQVSTTVYRAALNAGLPIVERTSHSLYVTYYEKYGLGVDAAIFPPGNQDLVFRNDTADYLLLQAYDDGFEARVRIYGRPDGRRVVLQGPFLPHSSAPTFPMRTVRSNEIAWIRTITFADGREAMDTFLSRYKSLPQRLLTGKAVAYQ
ncbi:MAG: von Willebrand factor A [Candidatus Peregrinibacteria bacterium Greene0416_19]|nr:MAG: von Willebrand factor A [Candidatus Peregrinibacteria bacterium Greene0416_19]